jgi:hypothetical protein
MEISERKGLEIGLDSFKKMKAQDRDILIYQNVLEIRGKFDDYKFHRKITYTWLFILTSFMGIKKVIGF